MITYSKVVFFLKLTFFLTALSILTILFVISPPDKFGDPVKVSTLGLEKNITFQILGAKLRGASESGHRFDFMVDTIDPQKNNPKNFSLTNLKGTLFLFEKDMYNISADKALFNSNERFIDLIGDLNIKTKSGITGKSQKIRIRLDTINAIVSSKVELTTPLGTIYGGTMEISNTSISTATNPHIRFDKGVKLVFNPKYQP